MLGDKNNPIKQIDQLLNQPEQVWLLGAGISKASGVPLMYPLTAQVETLLKGNQLKHFKAIRNELSDNAHVEHILSQIGDLIAIASRNKLNKVSTNGSERTTKELQELHAEIQRKIRDIVHWGFKAAENGAAEEIGNRDKPIVNVDAHLAFVETLFRNRRAGLERRPPVAFFTTNYDTLLEDALALARIPALDGFSGGAMAFWDPERPLFGFDNPLSPEGGFQSKLYKLHGSIDWFASAEDVVVRRREGAGYPPEETHRLLIYPQATKYQATQRDPFATLFSAFRSVLNTTSETVLAICGCSFNDDHISQEIETALRQRTNNLTVLAFIKQPDATEDLPPTLKKWLQDKIPWNKRIIVAGSKGIYHGNTVNQCPPPAGKTYNWWSFEGLTRFLGNGPSAAL